MVVRIEVIEAILGMVSLQGFESIEVAPRRMGSYCGSGSVTKAQGELCRCHIALNCLLGCTSNGVVRRAMWCFSSWA